MILMRLKTTTRFIRNSICNLKSLPNVKYALAGYDMLFPKIVSLACRILNISTSFESLVYGTNRIVSGGGSLGFGFPV